MLSLIRAVFTPFRIAFILLSALAIGMATGHINFFPRAHAECNPIIFSSVCIPIDQTRVCPNLPNSPFSIPPGFHKDDKTGDCVPDPPVVIVQPDPTPPPDVCPNIDGLQASLPQGFHLNADKLCVPDTPSVGSPPDVCPNLDGYQLTVPQGYTKDDKTGNCVQDPPVRVLGASTTVQQTPPPVQPIPQVLAATSTPLPANK